MYAHRVCAYRLLVNLVSNKHPDEWDKQRQEIQTAYEDQLNKAGQYDKAANKKMAALVSSFYTVAASKLAKERPDITPVKLMNEAMMRVSGGMGSGQGFNHGTGENNSVDKSEGKRIASESEVNDYDAGREISLESRLEQWRTANGLHDRRGSRTVQGEFSQAAEAEGNNGDRARPFTLGGKSKETIRRQSDELIL